MERTWKPYTGKKPYIFISYSHGDRERVFPVVEAIEKQGFRYWFDSGISAGDIWTETASERLKNCAVFLAFPSLAYFKHDNKPENCLFECRRPGIPIYKI